jgi:glycosyltransferase involved in cell wall biosynthesis
VTEQMPAPTGADVVVDPANGLRRVDGRDERAPLVSVVMTVRDGERFLDEALLSIRGQTMQRLELIVIDDGSTDATADILERHAADDRRVRPHRRPARGFAASLNEGCLLARGEYVARMDADDIAYPDRLQRQLEFLRAHPRIAVLGGGYVRISPTGEPVGQGGVPTTHEAIAEALQRVSCIVHPSVMMRTDAVRAIGGYRPALLHTEDYDLWLRMSERHEIANLAEPVLYYRLHPGQMSSSHIVQSAISHLAAQVAARVRRTAGEDPVRGDEPVSRELLTRLGVDAATIDAAIVQRFARAARLLRKAGADAEALAVLREGLRLSPGEPQLRAGIAAIHRSEARRHLRGRRIAGGAVAILRAAAADPGAAWSAVRRRLVGAVARVAAQGKVVRAGGVTRQSFAKDAAESTTAEALAATANEQ